MHMTEEEFLASYNLKEYDVPLSTVDIAIFAVEGGLLNVLMVNRAEFPFKNRWALPGGFVDLKTDDTIKTTAFRKLKEKTGISSPYLEQVETVGNNSRDPRGWAITVLYYALVDFTAVSNVAEQESSWIPVNDAMTLDLAFDHKALLTLALSRLRSKTRYSALPLNLMPAEFTLTELQNMFELVLDYPLEKKAFRRRLLAAQLLKETGEIRQTNRRPAALYQVTDRLTDAFVFPGILDVHQKDLS
jgi:8-oxo-dGTP diphosphatase